MDKNKLLLILEDYIQQINAPEEFFNVTFTIHKIYYNNKHYNS